MSGNKAVWECLGLYDCQSTFGLYMQSCQFHFHLCMQSQLEVVLFSDLLDYDMLLNHLARVAE